jgi:formylglycine-generating enzyme required for sulfatase activity
VRIAFVLLLCLLSSAPVLAERAAPLTSAEERGLKPKDTFKECDDCPEMVVVPAGSFVMGSPPYEEGSKDHEGPQRIVTFGRQFSVGVFAVTFAEWDACVAAGGCNHRPNDRGWGRGRMPVIHVSWTDAKEYVAWLSKTTGKSYRLPSEAEREYVARAGTITPFWWGSRISADDANYNPRYYSTLKNKYQFGPVLYRARTMPVNSFSANPWGLYQVHGNVMEWVEDCWNNTYRGAPSDGSAWMIGHCRMHVLRGGAWNAYPPGMRVAHRGKDVANGRYGSIGFRVGRTLE